jgi:hypothetical protein
MPLNTRLFVSMNPILADTDRMASRGPAGCDGFPIGG